MVVISARELAQSSDKYFDMALSQPVFLRRRERLFEIRAVEGDNPSPSGDPYFANPKNVEAIAQAIEYNDRHARDGGQSQTFGTADEARKYLETL